jgi:hypothetical protein
MRTDVQVGSKLAQSRLRARGDSTALLVTLCYLGSEWASEDDVLAYIREHHRSLYELTAWTRGVVLKAEADFTERVYRGWQGIGFHHPEAGYVCAIYPRDDHVDLLFEHGASLADPDGLLAGEGAQTRFYRVAARHQPTAAAIRMLVQQAVAQRLLSR